MASAEGGAGRVADAWALLSEHPALTWVPPLWREAPDQDAHRARRQAISAVERNLLVHVAVAGEGVVVRLGTGPLVDRDLGDGVDPMNPVARHDRRLDVEARTFEDALCALAHRVVQVFGPADDVAARQAGPSGLGPSGDSR